jgi:hypothetical protein
VRTVFLPTGNETGWEDMDHASPVPASVADLLDVWCLFNRSKRKSVRKTPRYWRSGLH